MKELDTLIENFINQECQVQYINEKMSKLIVTVCLCVADGEAEMKEFLSAISEKDLQLIKEALFQCVPYIGFPKVRKMLALGNFNDQEIARTYEERYETGKNKRSEIFGAEATDRNIDNAKADLKCFQQFLCSYCFGDFYTRELLNVNERELLTFCILSSLGGCESQLRSHIKGNLNVGNERQMLLDALTVCLPYIGFPKTLNAIACIEEFA